VLFVGDVLKRQPRRIIRKRTTGEGNVGEEKSTKVHTAINMTSGRSLKSYTGIG
jgi:hypothetical protein